MSGKEMHICVLPHAAGYHQASWRRPQTVGNYIWNWDLWRGIAQRAEEARLDAVFLADNVSLWPVPEEVRHRTAKVGGWDAFVMATAMATATATRREPRLELSDRPDVPTAAEAVRPGAVSFHRDSRTYLQPWL
jgi:hypothetical protein